MMLSRMAESLYWMSRYLERADNTARLIQINLQHLIGSGAQSLGGEQWQPLLAITGSEPTFRTLGHAETSKSTVVPFMTQERTNPNSIYNTVRLARENARVVRDRISKEMWDCLNQSWLFVDAALQKPLSPNRAPAFYQQVRNFAARFQGLSDGTMMGGEAYGFYRLGLFVERADMSARILDVKYHILLPSVAEVGSPLDYYQWGALLKSLSGFESFRRAYHIGIRPIDVTEFVVFNANFPRSLAFCVRRMIGALDQIPSGDAVETDHASEDILNLIDHSRPEAVFQSGLHEFLQEFIRRIAVLNEAIRSNYFEPKLRAAHALRD